MATDVLAHREQFAFRVEQPGGVQTAGFVERLLFGSQLGRQLQQRLRGDERLALGQGREVTVHGLNGRLAAEAAARAGIDVAPELGQVEFDIGRKEHIEHVAVQRRLALLTGCDLEHVARHGDHALGKQEAKRELLVVAGGAHGHGHRLALDADFQRLLPRQKVVRRLAGRALFPAQNTGDRGLGIGRFFVRRWHVPTACYQKQRRQKRRI